VQITKFSLIVSSVLLWLSIIFFPNQFLFSKTVPNSFWTEYLPSPFGAGWFVTFIILLPVAWFGNTFVSSIKNSILGVLVSVVLAVPIALFLIGGTLSINNLLNQYVWVFITCLPPLILHIVLRFLFGLYVGK
jgi:ABC-type spermidine/putrescine transport system permease subunit I